MFWKWFLAIIIFNPIRQNKKKKNLHSLNENTQLKKERKEKKEIHSGTNEIHKPSDRIKKTIVFNVCLKGRKEWKPPIFLNFAHIYGK